jgi:hypothetical protein
VAIKENKKLFIYIALEPKVNMNDEKATSL